MKHILKDENTLYLVYTRIVTYTIITDRVIMGGNAIFSIHLSLYVCSSIYFHS